MKIGLFSDTHYCDVERLGGERMPRLALERLKKALQIFKNEGVELIFSLGDLTDHKEGDTKEDIKKNFKDILSVILYTKIPFYSVPGNHDYLMLTADEIEGELGLKTPPYKIEKGGYQFIILDANYRSNMERFDRAGVVWDDSNLPPSEVEFLKSALLTEIPTIVLVHENLDPSVDERHIIKNAGEIRKIISDSRVVKMVIQGHYHLGCESIIDGVPYITLKAMCEGDENPYRIIEI